MITSSSILLIIILFILAAIFRANWLIIITSTIGILSLFAVLWVKQSLIGVTYTRRWRYSRGFPGETTSVSLLIQNLKRLPLTWLISFDPWPLAAPPSDADLLNPTHIPGEGLMINHYSLKPMEKINRRFEIQFAQRGVHPVGPVRLESGDIFGLFSREVELKNSRISYGFSTTSANRSYRPFN